MPSSELERLREVMARLRVECPWDARQTHASLLPHLIEEAGEVVDAVETGTSEDLEEELGDLLLQVLFHAHARIRRRCPWATTSTVSPALRVGSTRAMTRAARAATSSTSSPLPGEGLRSRSGTSSVPEIDRLCRTPSGSTDHA